MSLDFELKELGRIQMPKIAYVAPNGTKTEVDLKEGWSVMQGATLNGIDGISGECGGSCSCATCHVYVDDAWAEQLPAIEESEDDMLDCVDSDRKPNSRLGCQIKMNADLEGLVVYLPETQ